MAAREPWTVEGPGEDREDTDLSDPCITPPDARYRGAENQLYRVEIHRGSDAEPATFKWSRDNGTVVFIIRNIATDTDTTTVIIRASGA